MRIISAESVWGQKREKFQVFGQSGKSIVVEMGLADRDYLGTIQTQVGRTCEQKSKDT